MIVADLLIGVCDVADVAVALAYFSGSFSDLLHLKEGLAGKKKMPFRFFFCKNYSLWRVVLQPLSLFI